MAKVMPVGFLFLFCVVFLVIEESSGIVPHCPSSLTVSADINFRGLSWFYKITHAPFCFLVFKY